MALESDDTTDDDGTTTFTTVRGTCCDGDRVNNVWIEGAVNEAGVGGICMLDSMNEVQVIHVLQHDPKARADLKRVTSNVALLELAATVPPLTTVSLGDRQSSELNRHADSIPFYSLFRGNPPTAR